MSIGIYGKAPINPNTAEVEGIQKSSVVPMASPTGLPWLAQNFVRIAAGVSTMAATGLTVFPEHTWAYKACFSIVAFSAAIGILSQGARK